MSVLFTLPHLLHFFYSRMASFTSLSLHLSSPTSQLHMTGFCLGELHNPSTTSSTSLPPHDTFMPSFFPHSHSLQSLSSPQSLHPPFTLHSSSFLNSPYNPSSLCHHFILLIVSPPFRHQLLDRLSRGEEILYYCFDFLQYITDDKYKCRR